MNRFPFAPGPGFHHGPGAFGWLLFAVMAAFLVVAVIALLRLWRRPPGMGSGPRPWPRPGGPWGVDPALTELRVRYARGEITWEDFAERAARLGHPVPPGPGAPPGPPPAPPDA